MRKTWLSVVLLLVLLPSCRNERPAARRSSATPAVPDGGAAGPAGLGTAQTGDSPKPGETDDVDWAGLSDEETASRSGITAEECGLALAEGDGLRITVCDFIREVNGLPPRYRARFDSLERRKELLDELISLAAMEIQARQQGLDQDPETQFYLEKLLAEKMEGKLRAEIRQQIRTALTAADEEAYFAAHAEQFNRPELASAAHILVATAEEAQALIAQLTAPEADRTLFSKLAAEKSLDAETKDRGGNLAYFTRPEVTSERYRSVDPALANVVFQMQTVGEIHREPVQTAAGWHVLKLTGKRAAITRTLDQVRPAVRAAIEEERFEKAWADRLQQIQQEVGVETHPESLGEVYPRVPSADDLRRMHDAAHGVSPVAPPVPGAAPVAVPGPAPAVSVPPAVPAAPSVP